MIRICIADDQALIRSGICALLRLFDGLDVVAEAGNGVEAVECVLHHRPDVLLLDIRMPELNGIDVVRRLAERHGLPPTLLLTTFADDAALVAGIRAGARGFLLKGVTAETLVDAIHAVARGGTYLHAPLTHELPQGGGEGWQADAFVAPDPLTTREREVLQLMTRGLNNREIADALQLGDGTVRNHVSNILSKLGVTDRTRAVLHALEQRIV